MGVVYIKWAWRGKREGRVSRPYMQVGWWWWAAAVAVRLWAESLG